MPKKTILALAVLGLFISILYLSNYYYAHYYLPSKFTVPQPLGNVEFSQGQAQYPAGWPDELKFPLAFTLVDSSTGTLSEETTMGWSVKLKFQGKPSDADMAISEFFRDNGWTIVESDQMDSSGYSLLIQRGQGNGIIVLNTDPNNPLQTLIIATIFPFN